MLAERLNTHTSFQFEPDCLYTWRARWERETEGILPRLRPPKRLLTSSCGWLLSFVRVQAEGRLGIASRYVTPAPTRTSRQHLLCCGSFGYGAPKAFRSSPSVLSQPDSSVHRSLFFWYIHFFLQVFCFFLKEYGSGLLGNEWQSMYSDYSNRSGNQPHLSPSLWFFVPSGSLRSNCLLKRRKLSPPPSHWCFFPLTG